MIGSLYRLSRWRPDYWLLEILEVPEKSRWNASTMEMLLEKFKTIYGGYHLWVSERDTRRDGEFHGAIDARSGAEEFRGLAPVPWNSGARVLLGLRDIPPVEFE